MFYHYFPTSTSAQNTAPCPKVFKIICARTCPLATGVAYPLVIFNLVITHILPLFTDINEYTEQHSVSKCAPSSVCQDLCGVQVYYQRWSLRIFYRYLQTSTSVLVCKGNPNSMCQKLTDPYRCTTGSLLRSHCIYFTVTFRHQRVRRAAFRVQRCP